MELSSRENCRKLPFVLNLRAEPFLASKPTTEILDCYIHMASQKGNISH